jgi:hypothetical protein
MSKLEELKAAWNDAAARDARDAYFAELNKTKEQTND